MAELCSDGVAEPVYEPASRLSVVGPMHEVPRIVPVSRTLYINTGHRMAPNSNGQDNTGHRAVDGSRIPDARTGQQMALKHIALLPYASMPDSRVALSPPCVSSILPEASDLWKPVSVFHVRYAGPRPREPARIHYHLA